MNWLVALGASGLVLLTPHTGLLGLFGGITLWTARRRKVGPSEARPIQFAFVIPAHDEETTIPVTLKSLKEVSYPQSVFKTVVIADNCTDRTADVALKAGAWVLERCHETRRSKGFALEDILPDLLAAKEFAEVDAFVVVDADTRVRPDVLEVLAPLVSSGVEWIQGLDVVANIEESWRTKLLAFGFSLFNGTFQAGSQALGMGAHLRGNGMCLMRSGLKRIAWTAGGLAEDLEFSWKLRLVGERVHFARNAVFMAEMTSNPKASAGQRLRWEKGRHQLWRTLWRDVFRSNARPSTKLFWILDLTMPSLTSLAGFVALSTCLLLTGALAGSAMPAFVWLLVVVMFACLFLYGMSPFLAFDLPWSVLSAILLLPYYSLWRLVVALGRTPRSWIRTARGNGP